MCFPSGFCIYSCFTNRRNRSEGTIFEVAKINVSISFFVIISVDASFIYTDTNASVSVSIDERRVYTYNDKKGNGDIYFSDLKNGTFTPIAPIGKTGVNTETRWETHYTVSPDGNMAFFVSDKESGYGHRDIYYM